MDTIDPEELVRLRQLVRRAVEHRSTRIVAAELGMSHSWVNGFSIGRIHAPQAKSLRYLREWAERQEDEGRKRAVDAALAVLLERVPAARRAAAAESIMLTVQALERRAADPPPRGPDGPTFFCEWCNRDLPLSQEGEHRRMHERDQA